MPRKRVRTPPQLEDPRRGPPTKFTEAMREKIRVVCKMGPSLDEIASLCEIGRETLVEWRRKYPAFKAKMDKWRSDGRQAAVLELQKKIDKGNMAAIEFFLKFRHPDFGGCRWINGKGRTDDEMIEAADENPTDDDLDFSFI